MQTLSIWASHDILQLQTAESSCEAAKEQHLLEPGAGPGESDRLLEASTLLMLHLLSVAGSWSLLLLHS